SLGLHHLRDRGREELNAREQRADLLRRKLGQRDDVLLGDDEHVAEEQWLRIEEGEAHVVVEDDVRRDISRDDLAEEARRGRGHFSFAALITGQPPHTALYSQPGLHISQPTPPEASACFA